MDSRSGHHFIRGLGDAAGMRACRLGLALGLTVSINSFAQPQIDDQSELPMTINDGFSSSDALTFDWPMLEIGTGQYEDGPTGVTVIKFKKPVLAVVDSRGGGPGTINADYLKMGYSVPNTDAVVFAGGSWYGLEAATAVTSAMKDDGIRSGHWDNVGLALGSIIYDFGGRRLNEIYPDKRLAQAAYRAAEEGIFPVGPYGAGRSVVFGGVFGCNAKSGQGAAYRQIGELKIAVFVVVNAMGVVVDRDGNMVACNKGPGWPKSSKVKDLLAASPDNVQPDWDGERALAPEKKNTTISLVVTNRKLDYGELNRLAVQVHTSMARAIQPYATVYDGDVLYAVTTDEVDEGPGAALPSLEIGLVAAEMMWDAILAAVPEQPEPPEFVASTEASDKTGDADLLDSFVGDYIFSRFVTLQVRRQGDRLLARAIGDRDVFAIPRDEAVVLTPLSGNRFTIPNTRYPFEVVFKDASVVLNPGHWEQRAKRSEAAD
ncbi:MAG: P1 family peptidase [Pseudomonadota bacterium]